MTLMELHEKLGESVDAISSHELSSDELVKEIERAKAVALLAGQMVRSSNTIISARKMVGDLNKSVVDSVVGNK